MKVIDITDIEDLITTKIEIDNILLKHKEIKEKMSIERFMELYANLDNTYIINGNPNPFKLLNIYGNDYLFVTDKNDSIDKLSKILKKHEYQLNSFTEISVEEIGQRFESFDKSELLIINNKYYSI